MATIKDIADAAGVSTMTVSRYFNEPGKLKKETYDKIHKIVEQSGYKPNMVARLLAIKKTHIISVYVADMIDALHPFTLQAIAGIGEALGEKGYSMHITKEVDEELVCDGIISMGLETKKEKKLLEISKDKAVLFFGNSSYEHNSVEVDNYKGEYEATEYLISRGYEKIGHIGVEASQGYSEDRYWGYRDCLEAHGLKIPEGGVERVHNDEPYGYEAAKRMFAKNTFDGLVCASDSLALGAMRYAKEAGIDVPDELGVIGFDGLGYEKLVTPNITTMMQPVYAAGRKTAEIMIDLLENKKMGKTELFIPPVLQVNGTTK